MKISKGSGPMAHISAKYRDVQRAAQCCLANASLLNICRICGG